MLIALDGALEQVPSFSTTVYVVGTVKGKVVTEPAVEFPATAGVQV